MSQSRFTHLRSLAIVLSVLIGAAVLAYAYWSRPLLEAEAALAAGDHDKALAAYAAAEARFQRFPLAQRILAADHGRSVHNQLALLYQIGDYDAVIAKADEAPSGATPQSWSGYALFALATREQKPEVRLVLLSRAQAEFKEALAAAPDDWDVKFNYELTGRFVEALRKQPSSEPDTLMQLLRPTQKQPKAVRKRG